MERLFNNQIRPQAQPIASFVQPQQFRRANAAQPALLGQVSQIATLQQAGTSSVQGFNQIEQLTNSLAPFSKLGGKAINQGFKLYATSNIEAGYYDELRNATERSKLQLQLNQEAGSQEEAAVRSQLEKADPVGAALLREANPWKAIGRRRAMAQMAAGQVSSVLNADLVNNAGALAGLKPGSPELRARKNSLTQDVYDQFGLSGSELEAGFYITPAVNKSWDKYTQTQAKLYSEEMYASAITTTVAGIGKTLETLETEGIVLESGERVMPGDKEGRWAEEAGLRLTEEIDKGLSFLAGEDRIKAMAEINKNLGLIRAEEVPGVAEAINNIRLGRKGDKERPRWIEANPFELRDYTNKGLELGNTEYRAEQESIDARLNALWNNTMGGLEFDSPEYQEKLKEFEIAARELGKGDVEGWIQDRTSEDREIAIASGGSNPLSNDERFIWEERLLTLTPSDLDSSEKVNALYDEAKAIAMREPTGTERWKKWNNYVQRIRAAQESFAELPANSRFDASIGDQLAIDLKDPKIAALRGTVIWNPLQGTVTSGAPTESEAKYATFEAGVRQLMTNEAFEQIREWQEANPGLKIPAAEVRKRIARAAEIVRNDKSYERLYKNATEQSPASTNNNNGGASQNQSQSGGNTSTNQGPISRGAGSTITPAQAKDYKNKALMDSQWLYKDLKQVSENPSNRFSPELKELAKKAGVHPYRLLLEQLKFYPGFDENGFIGGWLEDALKSLKQGNTSAVPYGLNRDVAQGDRAPGAWLTAMTLPVQVAQLAPSQMDVISPESLVLPIVTPSMELDRRREMQRLIETGPDSLRNVFRGGIT